MKRISLLSIILIIQVYITGCDLKESDQTLEKNRENHCSKLGENWTRFNSKDTSLSFCYKKDWGDLYFSKETVDKEHGTGSIWNLESNNKYSSDIPRITYSTPDYKVTFVEGDVFYPDFWSVIDLTLDDKELTKAITQAEADMDPTVSISRFEVDGFKSVKTVRQLTSNLSGEKLKIVSYFIPNVLINNERYNLEISKTSYPNDSEEEKIMDSIFPTIRFH